MAEHYSKRARLLRGTSSEFTRVTTGTIYDTHIWRKQRKCTSFGRSKAPQMVLEGPLTEFQLCFKINLGMDLIWLFCNCQSFDANIKESLMIIQQKNYSRRSSNLQSTFDALKFVHSWWWLVLSTNICALWEVRGVPAWHTLWLYSFIIVL